MPNPRDGNAALAGGASSNRTANNAAKYTRPAVQSNDPFELILSQASGVKRLGADKAMFKSPTREDRTPSVSLCRGANGAVLLHDFGGDAAADVLAALGLSLASLFPQRDRHGMTPAERSEMRMHARLAGWAAVLGTIGLETKIVVIAGRQIRAGKPLNDADTHRLDEALERIDSAREVLVENHY